MATETWWLYIIEASDGSLYTGITNHLLRRWRAHCQGKGAKFFRGRQPLQLHYLECHADRASASRREYQLKQLKRAAKQELIAHWQQQLRCASHPADKFSLL